MAFNNGDNHTIEDAPQVDLVRSQSPPHPRPPPSFRACVACRQMKMKCDGVENPPCVRCRKVGRECVPQTTSRKTHKTQRPVTQHLVTRPSTETARAAYISPSKPIPRPSYLTSKSPIIVRSDSHGNRFATANETLTELPSIYSTAPIDTVVDSDSNSGSEHASGPMSRKRKRQSFSITGDQSLQTPIQSNRGEDGLPINRRDMRDMIGLFQHRHVPYVPVFRPEEFQDIDHIIDHEPRFAYAMCYVTAKYLPGGEAIRDALFPEVSCIPRDVYTAKVGTNSDHDMCLFKALVVLYAYADLNPLSQPVRPTGKETLMYWSLKSAAEMYGLRLSLHHSIQELKHDLSTNAGNIYHTQSFQRYTYWLFLYNMSHYYSIVTGTPPTMRLDSSIRAANSLLDQLGRFQEYPTNLFGATELCLIWGKIASTHTQLGEWWSIPDLDDRPDENVIESLLTEADVEIEAWYTKWWPYISNGPNESRGMFLDYHGRFIRFCLASYAVKCLKISSEGPTPVQQSQLQRCVSCANHVLEFPITRGPIDKDSLRYVDDASCIMVSFCCIFILSACQGFPSVIPNISQSLDNITEAAHLMIELSINTDHKPFLQGTLVLKRVEALKAALESSRLHEQQEAAVKETSETRLSPCFDSSKLLLEGFDDQLFHDDGLFLEPIWDFSMLLPST